MRTVVQDAARLRNFLFVVVALGICGTLAGVALSGALFGGVSAEELQDKLIASCEKTRSPLQAYFQGEIAATQSTPAELFPDIPRETFEQLIQEKVDRLQALVDTFDPHTCAAQYE